MSVSLLFECQIPLVEALFSPQGLPNSLIDDRSRDEVVVPQISEIGVQPVNSAVRLPPIAITVGLGVEHDCVRFDTIPPFCPSSVLNQVDPAVSLWNLLVLVAVPLRYCEVGATLRSAREG